MPPLRVLQTALRTTTEHLACELAAARRDAPDWSWFEWRVAQAAAVLHGAAPLLSGRLRWEGPPSWERFLRHQRMHALQQHERLRALLTVLTARLQEARIPAVALHELALQRLTAAAHERPLTQLDIGVRETDQERAARVLADLGLTPGPRSRTQQRFTGPALLARDAAVLRVPGPVTVELHTRICAGLPRQRTDITADVFPRSAPPGLNACPSHAALLAHLLLHAAGGMAHRSLRLLQLHDLAALCARMQRSDWAGLLALRGGAWWALPPLLLAQRYHGPLVPAAVVQELGAGCGWLLRTAARRQRLSAVSHSQLALHAFAGLEWSRSMAELVAGVGHRAGGLRRRPLRAAALHAVRAVLTANIVQPGPGDHGWRPGPPRVGVAGAAVERR